MNQKVLSREGSQQIKFGFTRIGLKSSKNMENFREKINKKESILSDWDKKYLSLGSVEVVLKMYEDFNKNFPDVILLPETTARTLYYLFTPIFEKLKKEKGTKIPKFIFFNVRAKKPNQIHNMFEDQDQDYEINTSEDLKKALIEYEYSEENQNYLKKYPENKRSEEDIDKLTEQAEVEKVATGRQNEKLRAEEIKDYLRQNGDIKIAILDDFSEKQRTANDIRRNFEDDNIPAYSIVGFSEEHYSGNRFPKVNAGKIIDSEGSGDPNPDFKTNHLLTGTHKFSYSTSKGIGIEKKYDSKYSSRIETNLQENPEEFIEEKKELRDEMRFLGNDLANSINDVIDKKYYTEKSKAKKSLSILRDILSNKRINKWKDFKEEIDALLDGLGRNYFTLKEIDSSQLEIEELKKFEVFLKVSILILYIKGPEYPQLSESKTPSETMQDIRFELKKNGLNFEDFGTTEEELLKICKEEVKKDVIGWIETLKNKHGDPRYRLRFNNFMKFLDTEVKEFKLSLEDIGTSEKELEILKMLYD